MPAWLLLLAAGTGPALPAPTQSGAASPRHPLSVRTSVGGQQGQGLRLLCRAILPALPPSCPHARLGVEQIHLTYNSSQVPSVRHTKPVGQTQHRAQWDATTRPPCLPRMHLVVHSIGMHSVPPPHSPAGALGEVQQVLVGRALRQRGSRRCCLRWAHMHTAAM